MWTADIFLWSFKMAIWIKEKNDYRIPAGFDGLQKFEENDLLF